MEADAGEYSGDSCCQAGWVLWPMHGSFTDRNPSEGDKEKYVRDLGNDVKCCLNLVTVGIMFLKVPSKETNEENYHPHKSLYNTHYRIRHQFVHPQKIFFLLKCPIHYLIMHILD